MNFLPGWFPAGAAAARAVLSSIVQQASATSTGETITAPADIIAGDLLVIADKAQSTIGSTPTAVTPSGFTSVANSSIGSSGSGTSWRQMFSYKIANGSEANASITGMNGSISDNKVMLVFRGNVPIQTATPNTFGAQAVDTNPAAQSVTASGGTPPLIIFGIYGSSTAVDPRTFTVGGSSAKDGEVNSGTVLYVAWKIDISSPADASIDMDDEGNGNILQSGYIALT